MLTIDQPESYSASVYPLCYIYSVNVCMCVCVYMIEEDKG